jgi:hypothetical protein
MRGEVYAAGRACTLRHAERDAVMFEVTKGELSLRILLHINYRDGSGVQKQTLVS